MTNIPFHTISTSLVTEAELNEISKRSLTKEQLLLKIVEESSELSAGICKFLNKPNIDPYVFLEELVDVELLISQFRYNYPELEETLRSIKSEKLKKVAERFSK